MNGRHRDILMEYNGFRRAALYVAAYGPVHGGVVFWAGSVELAILALVLFTGGGIGVYWRLRHVPRIPD
jgi:hypothetical protein